MTTFKDLKPGQAQFLSSFKPSLVPGDYRVTVKQEVVYPEGEQSRELKTDKTFTVKGPSQYQLPAGSIHSVYPAEGDAVPSKVLPQVTLSDSHLPWELSPDDNDERANKHVNGSLIPWLALLVFTEDEIKKLPPMSAQPSPSPTLSVRLSKKQLRELSSSSCRIPLSQQELQDNPDEGINTIFVNSSAFQAYFSRQMGEGEVEPAIARYSYLSHIRRSRSTKAQDATTDTFGIVLGHRSGPLEVKSSVTAYAHLVSLMGVSNLQMPEESDLTALVSLYSWSFTWTEGHDAEIASVIKTLADNVRPLRRAVEPSTDPWLKRRMESGYTLVKHRLQTGEQTASMFRGPLVPFQPRGDELENAEAAGHGSGLQIVDRTTGIVDITYSAAWSLGRSLAIENSSFTMAISALRAKITQVYRTSLPSGFMEGDASETASRELPDWYQKLQKISQNTGETKSFSTSETSSRWKRARDTLAGSKPGFSAPGFEAEENLEAVRKFLQDEVDILVDDKDWYARELVEPTQEGLYLAKVLDFVYNQLLTLRAVPHNYMFPEPDILDTEAVLTFYVDPLWVDTLVDGALSIGSHSTVNEDFTRNEIKRAINKYLSKVEVQYKNPRVPRWGAIICGKLLGTFDDPRIRTGSSLAPSPQLLVTTKLQDRALLLILNCRPSDLPSGLTISQAPHQQCFSAGKVLTKEEIEIEPTGVAPEDAVVDPKDLQISVIKERRDSSPRVFNFDTRCLNPFEIMQHYVKEATSKGGKYPATGSSALLSFVLGDKVQEFSIRPTEDQVDTGKEQPLEPFQLSTETRHANPDQLESMNTTTLKSSSGSIKLAFRALEEKTVPMAKPVPAEGTAKTQISRHIPRISREGDVSCIKASSRVLKQHHLADGTRLVDLIVSLNSEEADKLKNKNFLGINVSFPLMALMDPKSIGQPRVTLFGEGSARWISGSAYVTSDQPSFTVKLRLRAPGLANKVNFGFLLSNVKLSDSIDDDVVLGVEEEYSTEGKNFSGEDSVTRVVRQTCGIEGL
ncbi:uncharacterized protein BKA55DRAFT_561732 [Fusarium redolens]|uniref:Uncharacterized protein n=1 Tax=Fusarium redolens TaxID=48865 RepID=A0A9P9KJ07_FUSRE|nr:uncharacterized protein BKA55DRAFT_561732 [Fusarium redolens]KAH7258881.1 hypothetical protein BKA55DRAFT_561732 [Fusarium redolens]